MANPTGKGGFTKNDPRINKNGRPPTYDKLHSLAQDISHEVATDPKGDPIVINGHKVTITEAILRKWALSNNPILQQKFVEIAYGKPIDQLDVRQLNIDFSKLTEAQLKQIANGEDILAVISS